MQFSLHIVLNFENVRFFENFLNFLLRFVYCFFFEVEKKYSFDAENHIFRLMRFPERFRHSSIGFRAIESF